MVSLSLHETNPGHHLQSSYSIEQSDWPMFRKVRLIGVDAPGQKGDGGQNIGNFKQAGKLLSYTTSSTSSTNSTLA